MTMSARPTQFDPNGSNTWPHPYTNGMATRQQSSEGRQLKASESMEEIETPASARGATDSIAIRRARNRLAARKSRQKRAEKNEELLEQVARLEEQVKYWRSIALQNGRGNEADEGPAPVAANARTESPEEDLEEEEERLRRELEHLHRKNRVMDLRKQVAEARRVSESVGEDRSAGSGRLMTDREYRQSISVRSSEDDDRTLEVAAKRRRVEDPPLTFNGPKPYYGQTSTEYIAFTGACEKFFTGRSTQFRHDEDKISYALEFLPNGLQAAWRREEHRDENTWGRFKNFLLDELEPGSSNMLQSYIHARQGKDQTVADFVAYLYKIEEQLEPFPDAQRRDHLLKSLRSEITNAIHEAAEQPQTQYDLVRLATEIEHTQKRLLYANGRSGSGASRGNTKTEPSELRGYDSRDQRL